MKNPNAKIGKTLVEYYIINENAKNVSSLDIINNLKNCYNISEKAIYNVIDEMIKKGNYKVIN